MRPVSFGGPISLWFSLLCSLVPAGWARPASCKSSVLTRGQLSRCPRGISDMRWALSRGQLLSC